MKSCDSVLGGEHECWERDTDVTYMEVEVLLWKKQAYAEKC